MEFSGRVDEHRTFQWASECCMNSRPSRTSAFISLICATVCTDHASVGLMDKAYVGGGRGGQIEMMCESVRLVTRHPSCRSTRGLGSASK